MPNIQVKTYYLEMKSAPGFENIQFPDNASVIHWVNPDPDEYLYLYKKVGDDWGWTGRTQISREELTSVLNDSATQVYLLQYEDEIAGFIELYKEDDRVEVKYFGLLEAFQGKGLGGTLLKWGIQKAWDWSGNHIWVHTCEYDSEYALTLYQKMGFVLTKTETIEEFYEESFLASFNQK